MKVAVLAETGGMTFAAGQLPVAVILDDLDKRNIAAMDPEATIYCGFPEDCDPAVIERWLEGLAPRVPPREPDPVMTAEMWARTWLPLPPSEQAI